VAKYRTTAQNLGRITGELQEGVMRIRMVPISQIFSRFPRLVRDLSRNLEKRVNLVIEGEDTELDKSVIEDLLDPLMHSVRNAIDHGVESPAARLAAGKPEEGRVLLKASNEGNMIVIEVSDDGKGIDVERGLIHPSKILTEVEAFSLIFEPGFSTAEKVTNISGRGVGLDVVRTHIEKLNGNVTVQSQRGKGTRFVIKLPLTLAIIQGLLVRVQKEIYSIPITSVLESHRIKSEDIKMIDNYEVINIRSEVISLLRLDRLFRIPSTDKREYSFVVIVGTAEKKMGLMVDSLIGEEDVVIKPLRDSYTSSPGLAGASILGDGSVSLIIDVSQLLDLGLRKEMEERVRREAESR
jgi:two-component system chemotaxis sensor kinase CheA